MATRSFSVIANDTSGMYPETHIALLVTETTSDKDNTSILDWELVGYVDRADMSIGVSGTAFQVLMTVNINGKQIVVRPYDKKAYWRINYNGRNGYLISNPIHYADETYGGAKYVDNARGREVISHNADGNKSISIEISISPFSVRRWYVKKTVDLLRTNRPSYPTFNPTSVTTGSNVTITTNRKSSSFTHTIQWKAGTKTSYSDIATDVSDSTAWTVPDIASYFPNAASGNITIKTITYEGSTNLGSTEVNLPYTVPASHVPSISTVAVEDVSGYKGEFGVMIQNRSKLKFATSATGNAGSSITSFKYVVGDNSYSDKQVEFTMDNEISLSGNVPYSVTVTDSRGRTATKSGTVFISPYSEPTVTSFAVQRTDSHNVYDDNGDFVTIIFSGSAAELQRATTQNACVWSYQVKKQDDPYYNAPVTMRTGFSFIDEKVQGISLSSDFAWDIRLKVQDSLSDPIYYEATIISAVVPIDFLRNGRGVAIGRIADKDDTLQIRWNTEIEGSASANEVSSNGNGKKITVKTDNDGNSGLYDETSGKWIAVLNSDGKVIIDSSAVYTDGSSEYPLKPYHGQEWNNNKTTPGYAFVREDGVVELGAYIDFHAKNTKEDHSVRFSISSTGVSCDKQFTAQNISTSSDGRLKENISDISEDAAMKLMSARPVNFDFITGRKNCYGVIAQEIETLFPELVSEYEDGNENIYKSVDYMSMVPILLKMIQIQQNEINELKKNFTS